MNHNIGDMNDLPIGKVRILQWFWWYRGFFWTIIIVFYHEQCWRRQAGGPPTKWIGYKTYAVIKNLTAPVAPSGCCLAQIKENLVSHFKLKPPIVAEIFLFHKRDQLPGEPIKDSVTELIHFACTCNFSGFWKKLWEITWYVEWQAAASRRSYLPKDLTLQRAINIPQWQKWQCWTINRSNSVPSK